jgi:HK97 family phage portal protein
MFWQRRGAMDDRSPYGNFWFQPIGSHSISGVRVDKDSAMRLGAVFRCVSVLANTFPVLPFGLFKPRTDGGRTPQPKHWLYQLIARRPNKFQNPFEWRQMCMGHIALRGNCYNRIYANQRGEVTDVIPQHPDRVKIDVFDNGDYRYRIKQPGGAPDIVLPRGQMWHLRGLSSDGIVGMSPLAYARDAIGGGLAAQEYGGRYFNNNGAPTGGWIEMPGKFGKQVDRENFREAWQNARSGENRHKTPVLEDGMKFHELGIRNDEAQFLDSRKFSVTDICRFFGVPPHLAYDLDRSTNNNIEQQSLEFVLYTMTPISAAWKASIHFDFLEENDGLEPDFNMSPLIRADQASRSSFYKTMFGQGAYSPNDIRLCEGENPIEGGDQRFIPVNMTVLKPNMKPSTAAPQTADEKPDEEETPPPKPGQKPKPPKQSVANRLAPLAIAAAERVARKEVAVISKALKQDAASIDAAYAAHARFIADALGVELVEATAYCAERAASLTAETDFSDYELASRCRLEQLAAEGTL